MTTYIKLNYIFFFSKKGRILKKKKNGLKSYKFHWKKLKKDQKICNFVEIFFFFNFVEKKKFLGGKKFKFLLKNVIIN